MQKALWPSHREIYAHLQLTPWLILPFEFDADSCFREASSLLERFVVHRPYDQKSQSGGQWKSLGIRALDGDETKTQNHTQYGVEEPEYALTEIAKLTPETTRFLERLTDLEKCKRVRFMLLEPGAEISVHSDAPDKPYSLALNIALNMPEGCEFWTDLDPTGAEKRYSRRIPIEAGTVFLFNTSTYHRVRNDSKTPRIHIIVHGPLRFSDDELLEIAREQNGFHDHRSVMNALIAKKAMLGEDVGRDSKLFLEAKNAGFTSSLLHESLVIGVATQQLTDPLLEEEALNLITRASLYPHRHERVPIEYVDSWLRDKANEGKEFAVVVMAGTFIHYPSLFVVEVMRAAAELDLADFTLMGQILDKKERLPYLHEQFFIVNLKKWATMPELMLGKPNDWKKTRFPAYVTSGENIHDDYTPTWIEAAPAGPVLEGKGGFATEAMAAVLSKGERVLNVPRTLRKVKEFSYPLEGRGEAYRKVRGAIDKWYARTNKHVFAFNTEPMAARPIEIEPELFIAPCSGLKPLALLKQFRGVEDDGYPLRFLFLESNDNAIDHYERLLSCTSYHDVMGYLETVLHAAGDLPDRDGAYIESMMAKILHEAFDDDQEVLMRCLQRVAKVASFQKGDYFLNHDRIVGAAREFESTLFWHSNAWSSNVALFRYSPAQLRRNYRRLVSQLAREKGFKAWIHKETYYALLGASFHAPKIAFVSGSTKYKASLETFEPVIPSAHPELDV